MELGCKIHLNRGKGSSWWVDGMMSGMVESLVVIGEPDKRDLGPRRIS